MHVALDNGHLIFSCITNTVISIIIILVVIKCLKACGEEFNLAQKEDWTLPSTLRGELHTLRMSA